MSFLTIEADEIRVGDGLYMGEKFAKNPNHRYVSVKKVNRVPMLGHGRGPDVPMNIVVTVNGVELYLDPNEMVLVQRFDDLN